MLKNEPSKTSNPMMISSADFNDFFANGKIAPKIMAIMAGFIP